MSLEACRGEESLFDDLSIDFLAIDACKYFVLQLSPSGPTASRVSDASDAMLRLRHSQGILEHPIN